MSRLTEAVHRQVPLRYARAGAGAWNGRRAKLRNSKLRAHGFNQRPRFEQVVGYLERNEPLPLNQPDRKATSFVTSHFYLDDFVQFSEDPNPRPLQHASQDGFRTSAESLSNLHDHQQHHTGGTRGPTAAQTGIWLRPC